MSMFNDIDWTVKGNEEQIPILKRPNCMRKESLKDIGRSLALETKPSCMGTAITAVKESGILFSHRWQRFRGTFHPVFARASALSRGILRRLQGKETTYFNADSSNTELLFRIIHSANQLSFYGAVSHRSELFDEQENLVLTEKYLQTKTPWKQ